jgi:hypothetical protein
MVDLALTTNLIRSLLSIKHPSFRRADNDRISGWSQIRQRLVHKPEPLLYIFATCPYLLETLPSLAIDKRKPEDADTTGADHACLTGDTKVITKYGIVPIKDLNGVKTYVLSHDGQYHLAFGSITNKKATIMRLEFEDGSIVEATPDHKFMLADGTFKETASLTLQDVIRCVTYEGEDNNRDNSGVRRPEVLQVRPILQPTIKQNSRFKTFAQKSLGILQWQNFKRHARPSQRPKQGQQSDRKLGIVTGSKTPATAYDRRAEKTSSSQFAKICSAQSTLLAQIASRARVAFRACKESCKKYAYGDAGMPVLPDRISDKVAHEEQKQVLSPKLQNGSKKKKIKSITHSQTPKEVYCLNVPDTSTFVLAQIFV